MPRRSADPLVNNLNRVKQRIYRLNKSGQSSRAMSLYYSNLKQAGIDIHKPVRLLTEKQRERLYKINESFLKAQTANVRQNRKINAAIGEDVLLIPGDISNVAKTTIEALLHGNKDIRIPSFEGITGHPVFISMKYVELLSHEPVTSRLCDFLNAHECAKEVISVNDPFINFDIDTIEDYNRFINTRKEVTL